MLHLSSLPGAHGSGDLGPEAHRFVDWLAAAGQRLWQLLPLGPVGYGNSPYQGLSAFAGNPMFVALGQYTLFAALKAAHDERAWWTWPAPLARCAPRALADARIAHADEMRLWAFVQWCFDEQLAALRAHARARGVLLMGDVPIFVAHDSADCWARPELFHLGADHQPAIVSGVPPDAYTPDGQRWGTPLYRWPRHRDEAYAWWIARFARTLEQFDLMRVDHFRGFAGCWAIPAACPTARDGRWVPAPGAELFGAVRATLGALPIVAEDLGTITPDVSALLDRLGLPGMRIVCEGFAHGPDHAFQPHHHVPHCLAYTSTHDSDTVRGWWCAGTAQDRQLAAAYLGLDADDADAPVHRAVHRATLASVARWALAPMQDLLGLGSQARLNRPGTASGNWSWRFDWREVPDALAPELAQLARATARCA